MSATAEQAEVVVIDNASTDGTTELVSHEFPWVRIIKSERNVGYGSACNTAAAQSKAEYIAVVNQDVISTLGWIDRLVTALDQSPEAALATPKILLKSDPGRINACGNAPHYTGITPCRGYNRPASEYCRLEEVPAVSGAAFVIRRSAFESLGGFDSSFFLYFEDTDLSLRARLAGYRCLCVPDAVVLHDFAPRFSADKIFFIEANRHATWIKLFRWRTLLILAPALILTELSVWAYCLVRGPRCLAAKTRALYRFLSTLPAILQSRRSAQMLRRVADGDLMAACSSRLQLEEIELGVGRPLSAAINTVYSWWYGCAVVLVKW